LVPLDNPLIRFVSGLTFYPLLPVTILLFAWKAAVFPEWGPFLFFVGVAVVGGMLSSRFQRFPLILFVLIIAVLAIGVVQLADPDFAPVRQFDLYRANLSDHWLRGEHLYRANLSGANLIRANLYRADVTDANMREAYLNGAQLGRAHLHGADLYRAHLKDAKLEDANMTGAKLNSAGLAYADLTRANLSRADLRGAYLGGANLSGADLSDADLSGADLSDERDPDGGQTGVAKNLTETQLNKACGNSATRLPKLFEGLTLRPCSTN
jgi:uncharacterized protein YjbI with pentapeptide repeats